MPSFILIRSTVWPQCTNVTDRTDRQDRQRTDSIGRWVLQTVAQKQSWSQFIFVVKAITSEQQLWKFYMEILSIVPSCDIYDSPLTASHVIQATVSKHGRKHPLKETYRINESKHRHPQCFTQLIVTLTWSAVYFQETSQMMIYFLLHMHTSMSKRNSTVTKQSM